MQPAPLKWKEGLDRHREIREVRERAIKVFRKKEPVVVNSATLLRSAVFSLADRHSTAIAIMDAEGGYLARGEVVHRSGRLVDSLSGRNRKYDYCCGILGGTTTFETVQIETDDEILPANWDTPSMMYFNGDYVATEVFVADPPESGKGWFRRITHMFTHGGHRLYFREDKEIGRMDNPVNVSNFTQIFLEIYRPSMKLPINPMKSSSFFGSAPEASKECQGKHWLGYRDLVIPMESPRPEEGLLTILHFIVSARTRLRHYVSLRD